MAEEVLQEARHLVKDGIDPDYYARIVRANYGSTLKSLNSFESIAISLVEGQDGYDPPAVPGDVRLHPPRTCWPGEPVPGHMALSLFIRRSDLNFMNMVI